MSVDIFGRYLKRGVVGSNSAAGARGPPGVGFKLTADNQYDIEHKKLRNVSSPNQLLDAVNLETLQQAIQMEIRRVLEVTSQLRNGIDELNLRLEMYKNETDDKTKNVLIDLQSVEDLVQRNTESILQMETYKRVNDEKIETLNTNLDSVESLVLKNTQALNTLDHENQSSAGAS